jgi:hypothetical protein
LIVGNSVRKKQETRVKKKETIGKKKETIGKKQETRNKKQRLARCCSLLYSPIFRRGCTTTNNQQPTTNN